MKMIIFDEVLETDDQNQKEVWEELKKKILKRKLILIMTREGQDKNYVVNLYYKGILVMQIKLNYEHNGKKGYYMNKLIHGLEVYFLDTSVI